MNVEGDAVGVESSFSDEEVSSQPGVDSNLLCHHISGSICIVRFRTPEGTSKLPRQAMPMPPG